MFKFLKMIGMLKDIKKEYQLSGKLLGALASRKFWGALWMLAGYILQEYMGVSIDQATMDQGADLAVLITSFCMQGFGIAMQLVSYIKTIVGLFKKAKEEAVGK